MTMFYAGTPITIALHDLSCCAGGYHDFLNLAFA